MLNRLMPASSQSLYTADDVVDQLEKDFNKKCYICELGKLSDINVEHLHPHHGDPELKYDWNNLFLSCPHCNSVKNRAEYCFTGGCAWSEHSLRADAISFR